MASSRYKHFLLYLFGSILKPTFYLPILWNNRTEYTPTHTHTHNNNNICLRKFFIRCYYYLPYLILFIRSISMQRICFSAIVLTFYSVISSHLRISRFLHLYFILFVRFLFKNKMYFCIKNDFGVQRMIFIKKIFGFRFPLCGFCFC